MAPFIDIDRISVWTGVSRRQITRILSLHRKTGQVVTLQTELRGRPRELTVTDVQFLHTRLDDECDIYLDELRGGLEEICGVSVSLPTVWRALQRSGYTMKKLTRVALERSVRKRADYIARIGHYNSEQLVFVDESACDRRTTYRGHAWAIKGRRAVRKAFFTRGKRYSILPALSLDGILHVSIIEGSFTTSRFADFIEGLLDNMNPFPGPNSVVVMDNCRIHKSDLILEMIQERGMRVEFLPPYSPDFNPIELAFSAIKSHIRRHGDLVRSTMVSATDQADAVAKLWEAVWSVTPQDAEGWFAHCGYDIV